jgi:CheY-like chemotaxis protein
MTVSACALSGEEALAMAKRTKPDLALVDVELAGEDGFKLARSLIAQDPTLCVVLVSAYELEDIADLVAGCGASGFISKIVRAAFERYAVPGPGRVLFQGAFANFNPRAATSVDFRNANRAPLLLIAGENDHTVPAVVDRSAAKHYRKSSAITEYKEFPGRSHFIIGQDGWEEVADYALSWATEHASASVAA